MIWKVVHKLELAVFNAVSEQYLWQRNVVKRSTGGDIHLGKIDRPTQREGKA
jgi:hypothetical protein